MTADPPFGPPAHPPTGPAPGGPPSRPPPGDGDGHWWRRPGTLVTGVLAAGAVAVVAAAVTLGAGTAPDPTLTDPARPPTATVQEQPRTAPGPATTSTPSPGTAPTTPPPAATPTEAPTAPLEGPPPEGIDAIAQQVAEVRGLPLADPLDARVVAPEDLGARLAQLATQDYDLERARADEGLLTSLRLLDPDDDLVEIVQAFYREQVLGLYVLDDRVLYIGGDGPELTPGQRVTAAHEVLHALQDQTFDLQAVTEVDDRDSDGQLAVVSLVEGDAVLTQQLWSELHQSNAERRAALAEAGVRPVEALAAAPPYVRETLLFPYTAGFAFVQALYEHGGWDAVDAAFTDPPRSTRHVLRPETYLDGEEPVEVSVATTPGRGWEAVTTYTFGEFDTRHWLAPLGGDGLPVADDWRGGLTRYWRRDGEEATTLALRLGSPAGAAAACEAVPAWYATVAGADPMSGTGGQGGPDGPGLLQGDRDWMAWTCTDAEVRLGLAPDAGTASRLALP